jgi:hypothetical protein
VDDYFHTVSSFRASLALSLDKSIKQKSKLKNTFAPSGDGGGGLASYATRATPVLGKMPNAGVCRRRNS